MTVTKIVRVDKSDSLKNVNRDDEAWIVYDSNRPAIVIKNIVSVLIYDRK